jgi:type IV secretory pathway protease TraF
MRLVAARRRYLPLRVPLVKRVGAVAGDRVCAVGEAVSINGRTTTQRRNEDALGRPLPWWTGCETLSDGEILLLSPAAASFDGRYFGVTNGRDVIGQARLLWPG